MKDAELHTLEAKPDTVHWGYFDNSLDPVLHVKSGDFVYVETVTHHAGDAPDLMMDEGTRAIYDAIPEEDRAPGPHLLTGPIHINGAEPGDMIEVQILDLEPRQPYGSNLAAPWGFLFEEEPFNDNEHVSVYKIDDDGQWLTQEFSYEYPGAYDVNGRIIQPEEVERVKKLEGIRIPAKVHLGSMGVAPEEDGRISTVPPSDYGGNIDNWGIGADTTMYYPVKNKGALLSLGDAHLGQGDGELNGTGVEASVNCLLRVKVRKDLAFSQPILETHDSWQIHTFDTDLDEAARQAALKTIQFLQEHQDMTKQEAYSFLALAADLQVTQIVNTNKGIHVTIPKKAFLSD